MKTIFIQQRYQLAQMVITLVLIVIEFTISPAIFADISYYKALFAEYLNHSHYRSDKVVVQNQPADN